MNTTPTSNTPASGIHRGVWIGGGLMALTIIALATTLVVKNNDALPGSTATPVVAATDSSSVAQNPGQPAAPAVVATQNHEATRPVHHSAPARNETRDNNGNNSNNYNEPQRVAAVPACSTCGVIDGYSAVQVQGQNNGVGAVAGGLGGALVGSKIAGRSNHTLGGVIGAVGGGLLGNAIEKHERVTTMYDVRVRMSDGSIRTVRQATVPNVGARVNVDGNTLRAVDAQG